MVKAKVKPTCCLSYSEGAKPRTATYNCECGVSFVGLKAWREHMTARSMLRKRACLPPPTARANARATGAI